MAQPLENMHSCECMEEPRHFTEQHQVSTDDETLNISVICCSSSRQQGGVADAADKSDQDHKDGEREPGGMLAILIGQRDRYRVK